MFVSTVHKAKGLEFENVIIYEATDGVYPFFDKKTPEEIRESARLFYVAMTRAKKRLHITYAESVSGISRWGNPYSIDTISSESTTNSTDSELIPQICNVVYRMLTKKSLLFYKSTMCTLSKAYNLIT